MARPKKDRKTKLVRMDSQLHKELKTNFPNNSMSELLNVMYRTSAIRFENALRKNKKK